MRARGWLRADLVASTEIVPFAALRAIPLPAARVNQSSTPRTASDKGRELEGIPFACSDTIPSGEILAICPASVSASQTLPSGPSMIPFGPADGVGKSNSATSPSIVIRPTLLAAYSVNQRCPSCPVMMPTGWQSGRGSANARNEPLEISIRPISPAPLLQNQSAPSGPKVKI